MHTVIIYSAMVAALFAGAVLSLTLEKKKKFILLVCSAAAAVLIGVPFYVYGFTQICAASGDTVLRALLAVCKMFIGKNELAELKDVEWFTRPGVLTLFWSAHFLAFFVTSCTTVSVLGGRLLDLIRATRIRKGPLLLIYSTGPDAITYAARQIRENKRTVLFTDETCPEGGETVIRAAGALLDRTGSALHPDGKFLKMVAIRPGSRRLEAALLQDYPLKNMEYARALLAALKEAGISPDQTGLVLRGIDETAAGELMAAPGHYGFGSVYSFSEAKVAARLMVRLSPPCDVIRFDQDGRAAEGFHAVIAGFGETGTAVLEQLVMNGQFCGGDFSVDVFDPSPKNGMMFGSELMERYTIRFHEYSAGSREFFTFLKENRCNYIVLSTGDEKGNFYLDSTLRKWFSQERTVCPEIVLCTRKGVLKTVSGADTACYRDIYNSDALELEKMDRVAMQINQYYQGNGKTPAENWKDCDFFSRLSCRAAADFYPAVLRAAGMTEQQVLDGKWSVSPQVLENLAVTEHLRWCAFHSAMGYRPMDERTFEERSRAYLDEKHQKGSSSVKVAKDTENRLHACLILWEQLDALSEKVNAVTGGHTDYKQADRDNILAVPDVIRAAQGNN